MELEQEKFKIENIEESISSSFLDYSMSVIASRALPDVRDGLKPVHRRILHSMNEQKMYANRKFYKSARIVGDVIGNFHPHGDSSVYEALVRTAQPWSLLANLTEAQGNFGSIDGDKAAAMRYTEARMSKLGELLLKGIEKESVDFRETYDGDNKEPIVLPSKFPNLIVNGSQGIAVGMASNMPSHNLIESCDAIIAYLKNEDLTTQEIIEIMPGPDFPTGGSIMGSDGIEQAYETGRGSIKLRGNVRVEDIDGIQSIVITQVPYQVTTEKVRDKIREVQMSYDDFRRKNRSERNKRFSRKMPNKALNFIRRDGLIDETDSKSTEDNVRIVVQLLDGVDPRVVVSHLFKYTPLETSFGINNTVLIPREDGSVYPSCVPMKRLISEYSKHQINVIKRELNFDLNKLEKELIFLDALIKALDKLDDTIGIIRYSKENKEALEGLMNLLNITEEQANSILNKRIRTLTGAQQEQAREDHKETIEKIDEIKAILDDEVKIKEVIIKELEEIKAQYGQDRRTKLEPPAEELSEVDLIQNESVVVTMSRNGYIKSTVEERYRVQRRNGRGVNTMNLDRDDCIVHLEIMNKHDNLLLMTNKGRVYKINGFNIPESGPASKGLHIHNIIPGLEEDEVVQSVFSIKVFAEDQYLFFSTKNGIVKKTPLSEYENVFSNGKIAIVLDEDDELVNVNLTDGFRNIILITSEGKSITFKETDVRNTSRRTKGVIGINLAKTDFVVSSDIQEDFGDIFFITENGFGKKTPPEEFKLQRRGGKGSTALKVTEKTGSVKSAIFVTDIDVIYVLTNLGTMIKVSSKNISRYKRVAQGVSVINLRADDSVITAARASDEKDEAEEVLDV